MHIAVMIVMWSIVYVLFASAASLVVGQVLRRTRSTPQDDSPAVSNGSSSELSTH